MARSLRPKKERERQNACSQEELDEIGEMLKLDDKDRKILNLIVRFPDLTIADLEKYSGIPAAHISKRKTKPVFQEALTHALKPANDLIVDSARQAIQRLMKIVGNDNAPWQAHIAAAKLVLAPYVNQFTIKKEADVIRVFRTIVQPDGSLMQKVLEGEIAERYVREQQNREGNYESDASPDPRGRQENADVIPVQPDNGEEVDAATLQRLMGLDEAD